MKKLLYKTYLQTIKKSVGSRMFQNLYVEDDKKEFDVLKNGKLSCAYFVSNILLAFGTVKASHATVDSILKNIVESDNWKKAQKRYIKEGDVIVWEEIEYGDGTCHKHIGFYVGNEKAISHSNKKRMPVKHSYTFGNRRKIEVIYRYTKWQ